MIINAAPLLCVCSRQQRQSENSPGVIESSRFCARFFFRRHAPHVARDRRIIVHASEFFRGCSPYGFQGRLMMRTL